MVFNIFFDNFIRIIYKVTTQMWRDVDKCKSHISARSHRCSQPFAVASCCHSDPLTAGKDPSIVMNLHREDVAERTVQTETMPRGAEVGVWMEDTHGTFIQETGGRIPLGTGNRQPVIS